MTRRRLTLWAVLIAANALWMVPENTGPQAKVADTEPTVTATPFQKG